MSNAHNFVSKPCYKSIQCASDADVRLLIEQYPLAWMCTKDGEQACLLPLVGVYDSSDGLIELIGHYALANPLGEALQRDPRVTVLFTGPQGYVSPSDAGRRDWGPTWNYAQIHVRGAVSIEPELTAQSVEMLIDQVESGKPDPWSSHELGERYEHLMSRIVGFRIVAERVTARFKLGQDEEISDLRRILSNLSDGPLKVWMEQCNRDRLDNDRP